MSAVPVIGWLSGEPERGSERYSQSYRQGDENLNDPAEALRLADAMAAEIGRSPGQDDGRAAILLRKGDTANALAISRDRPNRKI